MKKWHLENHSGKKNRKVYKEKLCCALMLVSEQVLYVAQKGTLQVSADLIGTQMNTNIPTFKRHCENNSFWCAVLGPSRSPIGLENNLAVMVGSNTSKHTKNNTSLFKLPVFWHITFWFLCLYICVKTQLLLLYLVTLLGLLNTEDTISWTWVFWWDNPQSKKENAAATSINCSNW